METVEIIKELKLWKDAMRKDIISKNTLIQDLQMKQWDTWYYKTSDDDVLKPYKEDINRQLNELSIGESFIFTINNQKYSIKKTKWNKAEQTNCATQKKRQAMSMNLRVMDVPKDKSKIISEQRWYYQKSDGTLLPYTNTLNTQMNKAFVGAVITFSEKHQKYSVAKKSWNTAEQINLATKRHRPVFCHYEMSLNEKEINEGTAFDGFDELIEKLSLNEGAKRKEMNEAKKELERLLNVLETNDSAKDKKIKKLETMIEQQKNLLNEQTMKASNVVSVNKDVKNSGKVNDELIEENKEKQKIIERLTVSLMDSQSEMDAILKIYRYAMLFVVLACAIFIVKLF